VKKRNCRAGVDGVYVK